MFLPNWKWFLFFSMRVFLVSGATLKVSPSPNVTSPNSSSLPTSTTSVPSSITSAPTLTDDSQAARCWSAWNDYRSAEESADSVEHPWLPNVTQVSNLVSTLTSFTIWEDPDTIPMTTLCDGVPRAIRPRNSTFYEEYITTYSGYHESTFSVTAVRTAIEPECTVNDGSKNCSTLWSSWNSASSVYLHIEDWDNMRLNDRMRPPCEEPMRVCQTNITTCRLKPGDKYAQTLYYWPVTTTSGPPCNISMSASTLASDATECGDPSTVEFGDLTFTSPSVCGPVLTAITLTLDPTELTTIRQGDLQYFSDKSAVNWEDFNDLAVPLSAYNFQCRQLTVAKYWSHCPHSTKILDDYSPFFQVPQELISEAPEWKKWGCNNNWRMQPKIVRIEEDMTTSLEDLENLKIHKGEMTAMPMGTPTAGLAKVTATSVVSGTGEDAEVLNEPDNLEG